MLIKPLISALLFALTPLFATTAADSPRRTTGLNFGWLHTLGDPHGAEQPGFDDSRWQTVDLPHDASISGPFLKDGRSENGFRPQHIGWYRKRFATPAGLNGRLLTVEFEGVYRDAQVWINGHPLGRRLNGYVSFEYDLTPYLNHTEDNTLAVRYDNRHLTSRWYTGEGIYRPVWLHEVNKLRVSRDGVFIFTPAISSEEATVCVETEVANETDSCQLTTLTTEIVAPDGRAIGAATAVAPIPAHSVYTFRQRKSVMRPELWDVSAPRLYTAVSRVSAEGRATDLITTRFGIRNIEFSPEEGFKLNGRKLFLKGVNIHHDFGPLGAASFKKAVRRRLESLKRMGCNAVRLAHNPHAAAVIDCCDELGLLVFDECFDKWDLPDNPVFHATNHYGPDHLFDDCWQDDLLWFLKRDRSHPSVFIWSVGNEVYYHFKMRGQKLSTYDRMDTYLVPMMKKLYAFTRAVDPTRKITCGLFPYREDGPVPLTFHMDVVSDNYNSALYDSDHRQYPQLIFLESETATRNLCDDYFTYDHSYTCGQFFWGGTDYLGESFAWPSKGWNGLTDWCDQWKPITYYVQSLYSDKDMVKIAVRNEEKSKNTIMWNNVALNTEELLSSWNFHSGDTINLLTFTTGDEVELLLNGLSLGRKRTADYPTRKIQWHIAYHPGTLKAIARRDGRIIATDEIETAGKPYAIKLRADTTTLKADGMDLAYITATVTDRQGRTVAGATDNIKFEVGGQARLTAVGSGDRCSNEPFDACQRRAYQGKAVAIIRSGRQAGHAVITASARGLKRQTIELNIQ